MLLEFTECGMVSVVHVQLVLLTTQLPKFVPQYVPAVPSGPTLIENVFVHLTILTLEEFA